jgi:hypothetical protein
VLVSFVADLRTKMMQLRLSTWWGERPTIRAGDVNV